MLTGTRNRFGRMSLSQPGHHDGSMVIFFSFVYDVVRVERRNRGVDCVGEEGREKNSSWAVAGVVYFIYFLYRISVEHN